MKLLRTLAELLVWLVALTMLTALAASFWALVVIAVVITARFMGIL